MCIAQIATIVYSFIHSAQIQFTMNLQGHPPPPQDPSVGDAEHSVLARGGMYVMWLNVYMYVRNVT